MCLKKYVSTLILDWLCINSRLEVIFPSQVIVLPVFNAAVEKPKAILILDPLYETCFLSLEASRVFSIPGAVQFYLMMCISVCLL